MLFITRFSIAYIVVYELVSYLVCSYAVLSPHGVLTYGTGEPHATLSTWLLVISTLYFSMNLLSLSQNLSNHDAHMHTMVIMSYLTILTQMKMMFMAELALYMQRLVMWAFTVPLFFHHLSIIARASMTTSAIYFEFSVICKALTHLFPSLNTFSMNAVIVASGMASMRQLIDARHTNHTKYLTIALWTLYAAIHIFQELHVLSLYEVNVLHSVLDMFVKVDILSFLMYKHDAVAAITDSSRSLDDVRVILRIHDLIEQSRAKSNVLAYVDDIVAAALAHIENSTDLTNGVINTVFFGNSFHSLLTTGSFMKEFACVGVLFIDIVGYTEMCKVLSPSVVTNYMNAVYTSYDELLRMYPQLLKIETIGDAYMVVSGAQSLKTARPSDASSQDDDAAVHLTALLAFGQELIQRLPSFEGGGLTGDRLHVRIGVSCGPAAVSIVGIDVPRCCFFGHTVNLASRVQSVSQTDGITVAQEVYDIITASSRPLSTVSQLRFGPPRTVYLKGIGDTVVRAVQTGRGRRKSSVEYLDTKDARVAPAPPSTEKTD